MSRNKRSRVGNSGDCAPYTQSRPLGKRIDVGPACQSKKERSIQDTLAGQRRQSWSTTLRRELFTTSVSLYSMKPSLRNLFMN